MYKLHFTNCFHGDTQTNKSLDHVKWGFSKPLCRETEKNTFIIIVQINYGLGILIGKQNKNLDF